MRLSLLLRRSSTAALMLFGASSHAQPAADAVRVRPFVAPSALYSGTRGLGIGGGVTVDNAARAGSRASVEARLQTRYRSATVSVLSADAETSAGYGVVTAEASRRLRRRFAGLGPASDAARAVWLTGTQADAEARLVFSPLGHTGLRLEPGLRLLADRIDEVDPESPVGLDALDPVSAETVRASLGTTRAALSAGLAVTTDLRDSPVLPRRGGLAQAEVRVLSAIDGSRLQAARVGLHAEGFAPVGARTTLIAQASATVLRPFDADAAIPLGYLPALDERFGGAYPPERYVGRDVVAAGLGVRRRVVEAFGAFGLDVLALATVGNAYQNVGRQFTPRVAFRAPVEPDAEGRVSLRPGAVLGLGLVRPSRNALVFGGQVGISPGGLALGFLQVTADLGNPRPRLR